MRLLFLCCLLFGSAALADAVDVSLKPKGLRGKTLPSISVHILEPIAGFRLTLKRSDGKSMDIKGGGRPGVTRTIDLDHPEGSMKWAGELTVNFPNASTSTMPLEFETELYGLLTLSFDKDKDADLPNRKVVIRLNHPAAKVELKVLMDTGKVAFDGDVPMNGAAAGSPLVLTWPEAPGEVMRISARAHDTSGFHIGLELTPWSINIPHEEVNFDSGQWAVKPSEQQKVDASYALIADAVEKFGRLAELRLYVAGHTDTVGASAYNRKLSLQRARAIAQAFRAKGLRIAIFYEGFGEEAPLVATPDGTDEARNRRSEYTVSIDDPGAKGTTFNPHWQRL